MYKKFGLCLGSQDFLKKNEKKKTFGKMIERKEKNAKKRITFFGTKSIFLSKIHSNEF